MKQTIFLFVEPAYYLLYVMLVDVEPVGRSGATSGTEAACGSFAAEGVSGVKESRRCDRYTAGENRA